MTLISGKHKICKDICEALGLKHVRKFDLHMELNGLITISAEFYAEENGARKLPSILKEYVLVEKTEQHKKVEKLMGEKNDTGIQRIAKDD